MVQERRIRWCRSSKRNRWKYYFRKSNQYTHNPRKRQYFRPHYLLPDNKIVTKRKKVRQNPNDINSVYIFENEEIIQQELNENKKTEFKRDYTNNNDIIYEEDYSEVEENNEDYIIIENLIKKK